ncbi:MAG: hypothetical protein KDA58_16675, partial [Planctomycetaceae bacterium]|nr:hypothetical protein [Planctomycetaceae bacterium]
MSVVAVGELLWRHLWQITLLIPAAIILVRLTCRRRAHLAHALLLLCVVKCLVLPLWSSPVGLFCWLDRAPVQMLVADSVDQPTQEWVAPVVPSNEVALNTATASLTPTDDIATSQPPKVGSEPTSAHWNVSAIAWLEPVLLIVWGLGTFALLGYVFGKRWQLLRFHE